MRSAPGFELRELRWNTQNNTPRYLVLKKGVQLGVIGWYGGFRELAFFPSNRVILDAQTLRDLAAAVEQQTSAP